MSTPGTNTGNEGCPCINATEALSSLDSRSCQTASGEEGVLLLPELASCVPLHYGSNSCLQHDLLYSPVCRDLDEAKTYCLRKWCYVDRDTCKTNSTQRVIRSDYFPSSGLVFDQTGGADLSLYYSYATCNSTSDDWDSYKIGDANVLGGAAITASSSALYPLAYKRDANGTVVEYGSEPEYKDDSVPWEGVYPDFVNQLLRISNGDIASMNYTHVSNAASKMHPESSGTAVCQDIADGILDMAYGPFWITSDRLKLVSFTVPLVYDKTTLVIRKPGSNPSLASESAKVLQPFKPGLWAVSFLIIVVAALLSVFFTDHRKQELTYSKSVRKLQAKEKRGRLYAKLAFHSFLEKGTFFFGASIEQEQGASLSNRILMFGFGFFILIAVSAYVANLAAFLTRPSPTYVGTMKGAVDAGYIICAHPALRRELEIKWPGAKFLFHMGGNEFAGVLEDFDAGKCDAMAVGREDTTLDEALMEKYCERSLVFTDSVILETPIAFPCNYDLAPGFSYWIVEGGKSDITIENTKSKYRKEPSCNVDLVEALNEEFGEYTSLSPANMILPIIVFTVCALIAVVLRLRHNRTVKKAGADMLRSFPRAAKLRSPASKEDDASNDESNDSALVPNNAFPDSQKTRMHQQEHNHRTYRTSEWSSDSKDGMVDEWNVNQIYDADENHVNNRNHVLLKSQNDIVSLARRIGMLVESEISKNGKEN